MKCRKFNKLYYSLTLPNEKDGLEKLMSEIGSK